MADDDPLDPLLRDLRALPDAVLDELYSERVRRRAQAAFAAEARAGGGRGGVARAGRDGRGGGLAVLGALWSRAVLPTLLAGTVGVYLSFAVRLAGSLYR